MIAQELEVSLHMAFMDARQKRHEFISVEHLLLAMLDNPLPPMCCAPAAPTWISCARTCPNSSNSTRRWYRAPMKWKPSPRWAFSA